MTESESNKNINNYLSNDEIHIQDVFKFFKRNYKFISTITFLSIIISIFYSLRIKPTWRGEFQIVLESQTKTQSPFDNFAGAKILSGIGEDDIDTATEIEILKSPMVMKPVFNLYKEINLDNKKNKKIYYKKWLQRTLDFDLVEDTVVLTIKYKDTNKSNIIPILNKISTEYQNYSGRERDLSLKSSLKYVDLQITKKQKETKNSLLALTKFSVENNLGGFDGMIPVNLQTNPEGNSFNMKTDASERYTLHFQLLSRLEAELVEKSAFYKKNSDPIITLERKIKSLKDSLKRPSEILLKYRELSRQAFIDESSLSDLERQKSFLEIKKLESSKPWDLITTPTLDEIQFAPNKTNIVKFWALIGLILGVIFASIKEFNTGKIFSQSRLKNIIPFRLLKSLKYQNNNFNSKELDTLSITCFSEKNTNYNLLTLNDDNHDDIYNQFLNEIKTKDDSSRIVIVNNLSKVEGSDINFILINSGAVNSEQISDFLSDIDLIKINISGWFLLND